MIYNNKWLNYRLMTLDKQIQNVVGFKQFEGTSYPLTWDSRANAQHIQDVQLANKLIRQIFNCNMMTKMRTKTYPSMEVQLGIFRMINFSSGYICQSKRLAFKKTYIPYLHAVIKYLQTGQHRKIGKKIFIYTWNFVEG